MCSLAGRIAGSKSEMTECRSRCLPRRGGEDVWSSDDRCGGGRFWTKRSAGARVRPTYPRALPSRSYCCTGQAVFKADLHCRGTACGTELGLRKRRSKEQCVTRTCSSFSCAPALQQGVVTRSVCRTTTTQYDLCLISFFPFRRMHRNRWIRTQAASRDLYYRSLYVSSKLI